MNSASAAAADHSAQTGSAPRGQVWAWAMYDWAHSAYSTLSITVLMFYISGVVFPGDTGVLTYGLVISGTTLMAALLSPVIGAAADAERTKRRWLGLCTALGAGGSLGMALVPPEWPWVVVVFYALANLAYELAFGLYCAFLPEVSDERSVNRVSALGFGLGYVGGGLALLLAMLLIMLGGRLGLPEATAERNALTSDYHSGSSGTFAVELPPGAYQVEVHWGDAARAHDQMQATVAGQTLEQISTARGEFRTQTAGVRWEKGPLEIQFADLGGASGQWAVNGLHITATSTQSNTNPPELWFDFGTAGSAALAGSIWVLPGDRFLVRRLLGGESPRYKPLAAAAPSINGPTQPNEATPPNGLPKELTFGWVAGEIQAHDAVLPLRLRLSLTLMGLWWGLFSLPALMLLRDQGHRRGARLSWLDTTRQAFGQVFATLASVRRYPMLFLFLIAFLIYNDGVQTIITQAGQFAKLVLGIEAGELTQVVLMIQFVAWPGALLVGKLADRLGNKPTLLGCLAVYIGWLCAAFFISAKWQFWVMGAVLALVMGGIQSVSRAVMAVMTPPERSGEFFGFFNLSGKATSGVGPALFVIMLTVSDSPHLAVLSLLVFFVVGILLVWRLDVLRGQQQAQS